LLKAEQEMSTPGNDRRRALALCWLLHLMADLHQPLHTVALYTRAAFPAGDRGGNLIDVGEHETLHSLWDGAVARDRRWGAVQRAFAAMPWSPAPADAAVDVAMWARDGADLASRTVYVGEIRDAVRRSVAPPGSTLEVKLPVGYLGAMRTVARREVTLAGVRTALVLQPLLTQAKEAA
jgi:hypothetical protein